MKRMNANEWGDFDQGEYDNEMRNVSKVKRPENWQKYVQTD